MNYSKDIIEDVVTEYGEVFFVLESDREYEVHGTHQLGFKLNGGEQFVKVEGVRDGEKLIVEFPVDAIEHHYTHREV